MQIRGPWRRHSLLLGLALALLAAQGFSHGGRYRGPGDPRFPGGPPTPGSSGAPGRPGVTTGSSGSAILYDWSTWWEHNKDPFLRLREQVHGGDPISGEAGYAMGRGMRRARNSLAPTEAQRLDEILPALRLILESRTSSREMITAALMAAGKVDGRSGNSLPLLRPFLRSEDQEKRETAALAMGISGASNAVEDLVALARDTKRGRKLIDRHEVDFRTRAFACYGLGQIAHRSTHPGIQRHIFEELRDLLQKEKRLRLDVRVAALHGLRMLSHARGEIGRRLRGEAASFVWGYQGGSLPLVVQAHAVTVAASLAGKKAGPILRNGLLRMLVQKDSNPWLRQSVALALGDVIESDDKKALRAMQNYADRGRDRLARNFMYLTLGRIGGEANRSYLLNRLRAGRTQKVRKSWLAIAIGLYDWKRRSEDAGASPDKTAIELLLREFRAIKNAQQAAGIAVGLGLMRASLAGAPILERLKGIRGQERAAGHMAVALGLIGYKSAIPSLREIVATSTRKGTLLSEASIALALLGDRGHSLVLLDRMEKGSPSIAVLGALASAIGFVGDKRSVAPLLRLVSDSKLKRLSRAFSCVALGIVGSTELLPWNSKLSVNSNYMAGLETFSNGQNGVLDIL